MNIRLVIATLFWVGGASIAGAQGTERPEPPLGASPQLPEAVPELPAAEQGREAGTSTPQPNQTPPVQEEIIPSEAGTADTSPTQEDILSTPSAGSQPGFQRDVVPQSTEQERVGESAGQAAPVEPSKDASGADDATVQPDVIPDRRFETFDTETQGTPEMQPMPDRDDSRGGTDGLPPGGYGIGGPGR